MSIEDRAQEHEAQMWAIHNRAREVVRHQPGDPGYGPEECESCGAEMHPVRRGHGFKICVDCATLAERSRRR